MSPHRFQRLRNRKSQLVRILSGRFFPANSARKQTLEGRKKRLVKAMEERLTQFGWLRKGSWWVRKVLETSPYNGSSIRIEEPSRETYT